MKIDKKIILPFCALIALATVFCSAGVKSPEKRKSGGPITSFATVRTVELYDKLQKVEGSGVLFGHHFTNVSGRHFSDWKQIQGLSDVKTATGDYPAMFSFDFGQGFSRMLPAVRKAWELGGVVTISYHMENPHGDSRSSYVVDAARREVSEILPGGKRHEFLTSRLDSVASFASRAVVNGEKMPIIFRPWHEHTGNWFWWGTESCSQEEFAALWRFTVEYLRDVKRADNLLYAFSPSQPADREDGYLTRNPGPEWFDIAGFDCYKTTDFADAFGRNITVTSAYAARHGKIAACTEFGYRKGIQNTSQRDWYTKEFLNTLRKAPGGEKIVYAVTWTNSANSGWVPLQGDPTYPGFLDLYNDPYSLFLQEWKKQ